MRSPVQTLCVATALLLGMSTVALAASTLTAAASAGGTSLVMDGLGSASTHIVKVAEISVSTDAAAGVTLSVGSGSLTKTDGRTPVPFQVVLVERGAPAPASSAFTTASGSTYTVTTSSAVPLEKDLYIKYTPASLQDPGSYAASVALAVLDN